jgi:hypothetical protein
MKRLLRLFRSEPDQVRIWCFYQGARVKLIPGYPVEAFRLSGQWEGEGRA